MLKLTLAQVPLVKQAILEKRQNFQCAICPTPLTVRTGCLDHDHFTGIVRGVLCRNCNGIEGKIKNLVTRGRRTLSHKDYLGKLILYWITHETDRTGYVYPTHLTPVEKKVKAKVRAKKKRVAAKGNSGTKTVNRRSA
jgi:hypothetical protein